MSMHPDRARRVATRATDERIRTVMTRLSPAPLQSTRAGYVKFGKQILGNGPNRMATPRFLAGQDQGQAGGGDPGAAPTQPPAGSPGQPEGDADPVQQRRGGGEADDIERAGAGRHLAA